MKYQKQAKIIAVFILAIFLLPVFVSAQTQKADRKPVLIRMYFSPHCSSCIKVMQDIIPPLAFQYGKKVNWQYIDLSTTENYKQFLQLQSRSGKALGTPTIVIGRHILVGMTQVADFLELTIEAELKNPSEPLAIDHRAVDLLGYFKKFGPLTVIGAGLIDGINPCAFTVIVFFVSFLSLMGYKRREMALIGIAYIFAVFLTYLALGFGFFKVLYTMRGFYLVSRMIYLVIGGLSLFLGCLALNDYFRYKKTGKTDEMALQLPLPIKNKIHAIVGDYYRKDKNSQSKALWGLLLSSLAVGFMISLLEAVCTGQLYLPTIIFVLKEGTLRARALFYLFIYNLMFILPLTLVLVFALFGFSSKQFEAFARKNLGIVKIAMAAIFFALGVVLWVGA
jgi:glutaredoxin-related protein